MSAPPTPRASARLASLLLAALAAGCAEPITQPEQTAQPSFAGVSTPSLTVCKFGSDAAFSLAWAPDGSKTFTLEDGACKTGLPTDGVTLTELEEHLPTGFQLARIDLFDPNGAMQTVTGTPTVSGDFAGYTIKYFNRPLCTGAVGDRVWSDDNGNGVQDAGESGIPGVTVNLLVGGTVSQTPTTDATRSCRFEGLCAGTYEVEFVSPGNLELTTPNSGGDDGADSDADPVTARTGPFDLDDGEVDLSWDAGYAPCDVCKGGVTSITLRLLSGGTPFFDLDADETVEDLGDDTYRISGPMKSDGSLDKLGDFDIYVDGFENTSIHTSCSQPVDPGLTYGSFLVVAASSKDNGSVCPLGACSYDLVDQKLGGKKFEWKIENTGTSSLFITSIDVTWPSGFGTLEKIELNGRILDESTHGPTLSLGDGDFEGGPKSRLVEVGEEETLKFEWENDIHSSADFSITVRFNGNDDSACVLEFTGVQDPGMAGLSCEDGKPQMLVMTYLGEDCSGPACNEQSEDKVTVDGSASGVLPDVWYRAGKDSDPTDGDAGIWGMGQVSADGTLSIDATLDGDDKLSSETWVHLFSDAGLTEAFQSIGFHTSCSQPLVVGDRYGSLELTEFFPES